MLLSVDVESLIAERPICVGTQNQYRRAVRCYSQFIAQPATRADLVETSVNAWLVSLAPRMSPESVRGRKAGLTAVWNWLAGQHLVDAYNPLRLRRIRVPEKVPQAWSVASVRMLLAGAAAVRGRLACGVSASEWLTAWVWVGYESGLRPSDLLLLRASQVSDSVTLVQHKTGKAHSFRLSAAAQAALRPLIACGREMVFGVPRSTARRWELKLFAAAEVFGFQRRRGQGLGTLRKTHATEVCRADGLSAAALALGHSSGTLIARRHYVQPDAIAPPPAPPRLYHGPEDTGQDPPIAARRTGS
jgi:integrase